MNKMTIQSELEFEQYLRELIRFHITESDKNIYALRNKKAVDILICNDNKPAQLFFIEVKFHKRKHGRLGFGGGSGSGFQPEILSIQPEYFSSNMRWVVGKENDNKIYFLSNEEIMKYVSGGQIGEKYNNIQSRLFIEENGMIESQFIAALKAWLI